LSIWFRALLVFLYLAACGVYYLRYMGAIASVTEIAGQLQALGSEFGPRVIPVASFLRRAVMLVGTVLAVVIVLRPSLAAGAEPQDIDHP
jgi:hypothetical protein